MSDYNGHASNGQHNGQSNGHASNGSANGTGGFEYFDPPVPPSNITPAVPSDEDDPLFPPEEKHVYLVTPVDKSWEPTQRHLKIYEALCETGDFRRVALEYKTSVNQVEKLCRKIDAWVKSQHLDEIWSIRVRQKKMLEKLFTRSIDGYEKSCGDEVTYKMGIGAKGQDIDETTIKKRGEGNPAFLMVAREILADIRKLTGADKAPAESMTGNDFSVSQFNRREDAIRARIAQMEKAVESLQRVENN